MHIMQMERELEAVRADRDRQALFLTRILREVDHKVCACVLLWNV